MFPFCNEEIRRGLNDVIGKVFMTPPTTRPTTALSPSAFEIDVQFHPYRRHQQSLGSRRSAASERPITPPWTRPHRRAKGISTVYSSQEEVCPPGLLPFSRHSQSASIKPYSRLELEIMDLGITPAHTACLNTSHPSTPSSNLSTRYDSMFEPRPQRPYNLNPLSLVASAERLRAAKNIINDFPRRREEDLDWAEDVLIEEIMDSGLLSTSLSEELEGLVEPVMIRRIDAPKMRRSLNFESQSDDQERKARISTPQPEDIDNRYVAVEGESHCTFPWLSSPPASPCQLESREDLPISPPTSHRNSKHATDFQIYEDPEKYEGEFMQYEGRGGAKKCIFNQNCAIHLPLHDFRAAASSPCPLREEDGGTRGDEGGEVNVTGKGGVCDVCGWELGAWKPEPRKSVETCCSRGW